MSKRFAISVDTQKKILVDCKRRCCLCFFLENNTEIRRGQIAHINRRRNDNRPDNLVYLCMDHHDDFDSPRSQSKGLQAAEIKEWRNKLTEHCASHPELQITSLPNEECIGNPADDNEPRPWRFPAWQIANQPELFAFTVKGGSNGICSIERINLPDGRTAIVCASAVGNPGKSITNAVEEICTQVCERFEINPAQLTWLELYDNPQHSWNRVVFGTIPPAGPFSKPQWYPMTPIGWHNLQLEPLELPAASYGKLNSQVKKLFDWPTDAILD